MKGFGFGPGGREEEEGSVEQYRRHARYTTMPNPARFIKSTSAMGRNMGADVEDGLPHRFLKCQIALIVVECRAGSIS